MMKNPIKTVLANGLTTRDLLISLHKNKNVAIKENLLHAFLFNLEMYDEGNINKEDFINAMEEYIYE
jgi:hypothetical protein